MATPGTRSDPYRAYNFLVEIEGLVVAGFSEVGGLQAELEVLDHPEGGLNTYTHRLPGRAKPAPNLTLKRGLTEAEGLWRWYQATARGLVVRRNGSIVLRDDAGHEGRRWNFFEAFPVRWVGPQLSADSQTVAFETLELAHHGLFPLDA